MFIPLTRLVAPLLAAGLILVGLCPGAAQAAAPPIEYRERVLENGLRVLSAVDETTPNVTVQVWYGVGAKDDPEGRSGFAHLFEHMMFKTTRNMPAEMLDRMTEDVGGFNNASTWDDFTNYFEVVPANHLRRILWAEAERMGALVVDPEIFNSERDVVKEELRQRVLADPYGRLFALMIPQASYEVHPYRRPGIGSIAELDAATGLAGRVFRPLAGPRRPPQAGERRGAAPPGAGRVRRLWPQCAPTGGGHHLARALGHRSRRGGRAGAGRHTVRRQVLPTLQWAGL